MKYIKFNDILIGRKFKTSSNIVYQKVSTTEAKPVKKANGDNITNGLVTSALYNTNIQLTEVV